MTREEAIAYFKDMNECTYGNVEPIQMAIKALEQEPVLDKIRSEIQNLRNCSCSCSDGIIDDVEDIIDKYKAETENT